MTIFVIEKYQKEATKVHSQIIIEKHSKHLMKSFKLDSLVFLEKTHAHKEIDLYGILDYSDIVNTNRFTVFLVCV